MDKNAQLEARVWSRVMGKTLEIDHETGEIEELLRQEYWNFVAYKCLLGRLPQHRDMVQSLLRCTENNIKILKTMYYIENGRHFVCKKCEKVEIFSVCSFLRERYREVQKGSLWLQKGAYNGEKWEEYRYNLERNKKQQGKCLLCILQSLL